MVDLILPRRSRTSKNPTQRPEPKPTHAPVQSSKETNIVGTVTKTIKGANELLLYWKDGLTAEERAAARSKEERKQILSLRMKTVSSTFALPSEASYTDSLTGKILDAVASSRRRARHARRKQRMEARLCQR
jgi:hypothetical protein